MNSREETIETYDRTAVQMAEKFRGMGARVEDIDKAFALINK